MSEVSCLLSIASSSCRGSVRVVWSPSFTTLPWGCIDISSIVDISLVEFSRDDVQWDTSKASATLPCRRTPVHEQLVNYRIELWYYDVIHFACPSNIGRLSAMHPGTGTARWNQNKLKAQTMHILWAETQNTLFATILLTVEVWICLFCNFIPEASYPSWVTSCLSNTRSWHNVHYRDHGIVPAGYYSCRLDQNRHGGLVFFLYRSTIGYKPILSGSNDLEVSL